MGFNQTFSFSTNSIISHCESVLYGNKIFSHVLDYSSSELELFYEKGYNYLISGNLEEACIYFSFLLVQQPYDRRFHFAYACTLKELGDYKNALTFFGYAITMQANDPYAFYHTGVCFMELDEIDAARDALDSCILLCHGQENLSHNYNDLCKHATQILSNL